MLDPFHPQGVFAPQFRPNSRVTVSTTLFENFSAPTACGKKRVLAAQDASAARSPPASARPARHFRAGQGDGAASRHTPRRLRPGQRITLQCLPEAPTRPQSRVASRGQGKRLPPSVTTLLSLDACFRATVFRTAVAVQQSATVEVRFCALLRQIHQTRINAALCNGSAAFVHVHVTVTKGHKRFRKP